MKKYTLKNIRASVELAKVFGCVFLPSVFKGAASDVTLAIESLKDGPVPTYSLMALANNSSLSDKRRGEVLDALNSVMEDPAKIQKSNRAMAEYIATVSDRQMSILREVRTPSALAKSDQGDHLKLPANNSLDESLPFGELEQMSLAIFYNVHLIKKDVVESFVLEHGKMGLQIACWRGRMQEIFQSGWIYEQGLADDVARAGLTIKWRNASNVGQKMVYAANISKGDSISEMMVLAPMFRSIDGERLYGSRDLNRILYASMSGLATKDQLHAVSVALEIDNDNGWDLVETIAKTSDNCTVKAMSFGIIIKKGGAISENSMKQTIAGLASVKSHDAINFVAYADALGVSGACKIKGYDIDLAAWYFARNIDFANKSSFSAQLDGISKYGKKIIDIYGEMVMKKRSRISIAGDTCSKIRLGKTIFNTLSTGYASDGFEGLYFANNTAAAAYLLTVTSPFVAAQFFSQKLCEAWEIDRMLESLKRTAYATEGKLLAAILYEESQKARNESERNRRVVRGDYGFRSSTIMSRTMYKDEVSFLKLDAKAKSRMRGLASEVGLEDARALFVEKGGELARGALKLRENLLCGESDDRSIA